MTDDQERLKFFIDSNERIQDAIASVHECAEKAIADRDVKDLLFALDAARVTLDSVMKVNASMVRYLVSQVEELTGVFGERPRLLDLQ